MTAKTLLVFALSVAVCTVAAGYRFYDSAHTIGMIKAEGGKARHPIVLDKGRDSYTLIATAAVTPPYRGDVRVAVEGTPAMDYVIYPSEAAIDLSPYRHPTFRDNVLYDLQPRDKVALWVVMKPKKGGEAVAATSGVRPPKQDECCDLPVAAAPAPAMSAQTHGGAATHPPGERPRGGGGKSGRPEGAGATQRLAFYDTATGKAVLTVPIVYKGAGEGGNEVH